MPKRRTHSYFWFILACAIVTPIILLFHLRPLEKEFIMSDAMMMTTTPRDERLEKKCSDAVGKLVDLKINFLAIDFDQTMIDIHTGGRWKESVSSLTTHLRPLFLHLIPIATSSQIRIAIVTFSPQTKHIREVLEYAYSPNVAECIPIRGNDGSWTYVGNGMKMGKQEHMASAAEELMAKPMPDVGIISKSTTLLIDDDPKNIKKSLKDGARAVWINPRDPLRLLDDIMRLK
mmetsp:Transcript_127/g.288  ORF Transcript_127/g.288 Transcript_127/m.288 type:complete len:232 (-) Transcript_127:435-1130(-)